MASASGLVVDDIQNELALSPDHLAFIKHLDEGHEVYTRHFDALLIKRAQHHAFFHDLRVFRQLPSSVVQFEKLTRDKTAFRALTTSFLQSQYAHPWFAVTSAKSLPSQRLQSGSGSTQPTDDQLHRTLVPLWAAVRTKMFPAPAILDEFAEKYRAGLIEPAHLSVGKSTAQNSTVQVDLRAQARPGSSRSDSSDGMSEDVRTAGRILQSITRLAAAGALLSQQPKRKLRWLTKKP